MLYNKTLGEIVQKKNASMIVELVKYLADKFNSTFYDYMNKRLSSEYSTSAINDDSSYVFKPQNKYLAIHCRGYAF